MSKSKFQGIIFGLLMSYAMAYGMEVYNVAIKMGFNLNQGGFSNMTNQVFIAALKEASFMGFFVFIFSNLWGNKIGAKLAARHANPDKDTDHLIRIRRQAYTVGIMCPTMSLFASILFSIIIAGGQWRELPAIWTGTVLKNFPMAFLWNMYAAAPFTHWCIGLIFKTHM